MSWSFSRRGGYTEAIDKSVRSNFEGKLKNYLTSKGISFEYESLRIPYESKHYYKPDFVLDNGIIIEAKGLFLPKDRQKHLLIKKQNPNLDIRFIFQRDQRLNKTSKTTYSMWCKKNGFKYHIGTIVPTEWISEVKEDH